MTDETCPEGAWGVSYPGKRKTKPKKMMNVLIEADDPFKEYTLLHEIGHKIYELYLKSIMKRDIVLSNMLIKLIL